MVPWGHPGQEELCTSPSNLKLAIRYDPKGDMTNQLERKVQKLS